MVENDKIPNWAEKFISETGRKNISEAVRVAELQTSAEIVPMLVKSSSLHGYFDNYIYALLISLLFALQAEDYILHIMNIWDISHWHRILAILTILAVSWPFASLLSRNPLLFRIFGDRRDKFDSVNARAEIEFYRAGLTHTKGSTGILIFISLEERRAVILGDQSINEKIAKDSWDKILTELLNEIKSANLETALKSAIEKVTLLAKPHFPRATNDADELSNALVIKD